MPSPHHPYRAAGEQPRARVLELVTGITPADTLEAEHLRTTRHWITNGAPLCRMRPPDVPPMHLVSYIAVRDAARGQMLQVSHRKAGLWLPAGGHVEPGEDPWETVVRECREELHIDAVPSPTTGPAPLFLTVTPTRGPHSHTDVSLWYVLHADADAVTTYDEREFASIRWLTDAEVLDEPIEAVDPHMHRFTHKLQHTSRTA